MSINLKPFFFILPLVILIHRGVLGQNTTFYDKPQPKEHRLLSPLKFYILPVVAGQLPIYVCEVRLAYEWSIAKQQSLQFGFSAEFPGLIQTIGQGFSAVLSISPYWVFGTREFFSYRYYINSELENLRGFYVGPEISFNLMGTPARVDYLYGEKEIDYTFPASRTGFIMFNGGVAFGEQFVTKERRGRVNLIDIGASIYGRYDYFWRRYPGYGNIEMAHDVVGASNIYGYYKLVPVGASFNVAIRWYKFAEKN